MEKLIISRDIKSNIDEINNMPYFWASIPLPDLSDMPNLNRKLVISGFNFPDLENSGEERLELTIKQILVNNSTGNIFKVIKLPTKTLYSFDESPLIDSTGNTLKGDLKKYDEDGNEYASEKIDIKVNAVKLIKFKLIRGDISLTDLMKDLLINFADSNKDLLNTI